MLLVYRAAITAALLTVVCSGRRERRVNDVIMTVLDSRKGEMVNISFPNNEFENFHECMCEEDDATCIAEYRPCTRRSGPYCVYDIEDKGSVSSEEILPRCYACATVPSARDLECRHVSVCSRNISHTQSFRITNSQDCSSTCVTLLWNNPGEKLIFKPGSVFNVTSCDNDCGCPTPAPPQPTTTTTTTREPPLLPTASATTSRPKPSTPTMPGITEMPANTIKPQPAATPITTTTRSTEDSGSPTIAASASKGHSDETPLGAIIGVVIAVAGVLLVLFIAIILWRRRRASMGDKHTILYEDSIRGSSSTTDLTSSAYSGPRLSYIDNSNSSRNREPNVYFSSTTAAEAFVNRSSNAEVDSPDFEKMKKQNTSFKDVKGSDDFYPFKADLKHNQDNEYDALSESGYAVANPVSSVYAKPVNVPAAKGAPSGKNVGSLDKDGYMEPNPAISRMSVEEKDNWKNMFKPELNGQGKVVEENVYDELDEVVQPHPKENPNAQRPLPDLPPPAYDSIPFPPNENVNSFNISGAQGQPNESKI